MKDLTILMEDRPGTLANVGEALGNAGVNIEGMCGFGAGGQGTAHPRGGRGRCTRGARGRWDRDRAERDVIGGHVRQDQPGTTA
jgi:hypothetical protein